MAAAVCAGMHQGMRMQAGTYFMVSDYPDGPYTFSANPLLLGSGLDRQESWQGPGSKNRRQMAHIFTYEFKNAFANLKEIVRSEDGGLELKYFPAIEKLTCDNPRVLCEPKHIEGSGPSDGRISKLDLKRHCHLWRMHVNGLRSAARRKSRKLYP